MSAPARAVSGPKQALPSPVVRAARERPLRAVAGPDWSLWPLCACSGWQHSTPRSPFDSSGHSALHGRSPVWAALGWTPPNETDEEGRLTSTRLLVCHSVLPALSELLVALGTFQSFNLSLSQAISESISASGQVLGCCCVAGIGPYLTPVSL